MLGSRGSADTVRDVRGFAVKFYTEEGNLDLIGNNMPVFFIQDGIKFPDVIHACKPHPDPRWKLRRGAPIDCPGSALDAGGVVRGADRLAFGRSALA